MFATDCYLLGSLIVFYFAGISMTALLRKHIPDIFCWEKWNGPFEELRPYLNHSFSKSLIEFEENIEYTEFKKEIRDLVEYLCHPFPEKRGHPKNVTANKNIYSLERFIQRLDLLKRKAELKIKI